VGDEAVAGRGRVVLLTGEAGIGKTTMLTEAARYADIRGARVAWGWGWPDEGAPGYWPWAQVTRDLGLGGLPADGAALSAVDAAPASARFQLFDEVTSLLLAESRMQPLVILLDDLQWADEPSLRLLDFFARRLPAGSAAVIGAYRDIGQALDPALAAVAARSTVLPLAGLPVDAVTQLVARALGEQRAVSLGADVHRRTGGNPFFVQQVSWLLASGDGGLPPGVREALDQRFGGLPGECVAALSAAAVAGQRFSAGLLARATGATAGQVASALAEAVRTRILIGGAPEGYRFAHDLFREYACQRLSVTEQARWHAKIGVTLEADLAHGGVASLAELAGHFVQADPGSERARHYSVAAAREATSRLDYEEAVRHWERALAAVGEAGEDQIGTLLELAEACRRAGTGQEAGEAFLRAAGLARSERNAPGLARAALGLQAIGGRAWWPPDELVAILSEALVVLSDGEAETAALRSRVMAGLARVLGWHGLDLPRARALAGEAVAVARQLGDLHLIAACLMAQHNAIWQPGTAQERRGLAIKVIELVQDAGAPELLLEARLLAATDLMELADPAFRAELDEFLRLAGAAGQPRFRYAALVRRAMLALLAGRFAEAQRLIEQAAMLGEECGEPGARDVWNDQTWDLLAAQGRLGELAGVLPEMFPDPESRPARGLQAMALLAAGADAQAAEMIAPVLEEHASPPADRQWLLGMAYGTELAVAFGSRPLAEHVYQELSAYADQTVVSGAAITFRGAVAHYLGVLAAMLGRTAEAVIHLERAIAVHERLGALPWALRSRYELAGSWLHEPARRDAAVAALAEVAGEAHRLGLTQLARDAEARGFAAGRTPVASGMLRRDGTQWTLSYGGVTVRMRHAKGLADLAVLLARPGRPVPAADLIAAAGAGEAALADLRLGSDEIFDATARRQIQVRLADLDNEIAEAESWADSQRATQAREERDAVLRELAAAAGLAGRSRLLGDQSERARKTVTARIRDVIGRIEQVHPALGAHLTTSITTGTYCAYSPPTPVSWQL
jgi:tetratricopeptide (TPR) repeat protein